MQPSAFPPVTGFGSGPALLALAGSLAAAAPGCGGTDVPGARELPRPELVVLVSLDTLRADHLDIYGYERQTAPELSALARDGYVFTNAYSQAGQTLSSHKSIFLARYPLSILYEETHAGLEDLTRLDQPRDWLYSSFVAARGSLVHGLTAAGWGTAAFTDGAYVSSETGMDDGFDLFDDRAGGLKHVLPRAVRWLDERSAGSAFLFVHGYDIHCPYPCREPYDTLFCAAHADHVALEGWCGKQGLELVSARPVDRAAVVDHYDGGIASADAYLGVFLDQLRARGLYEGALIVVLSDHGESLWEHGIVGHGALALEQLHVPLIIKPPASWQAGSGRIDEPVELIDVMPTVLAACGIAAPEGIDGHSLLEDLFGSRSGRRYVVAQTTFQEPPEYSTNPAKRTLIEPGRFQLVHDARTQTAELYDLRTDPAALVNVFAEHRPESPALLQALLARDHERSAGELLGPSGAEPSEELRQALEKLGYF